MEIIKIYKIYKNYRNYNNIKIYKNYNYYITIHTTRETYIPQGKTHTIKGIINKY